ncbi:MAG: 50S ribosomal protein L25/general stress protein Ctc [Francisellaceae bacterium]|jgi:large subunit ribosomal protein L25|nr:50S ribosomal protein L25/general stress protein Ctc [Francisellaceae bacterium]MBT6537939.1 50S ribosomal protein L25/general stress protein Ctc [Francisellaceae bacterium]
MTKAIFELDATKRQEDGTGASRRLRRIENRVPAIIYGGKEAPRNISLCHLKVLQALSHESFYSHILTLNIEDKKQKVVLKDLQRHPYKKSILHMDFQRVSDSDKITMNIPLHFINEDSCPGAKLGGLINHQFIDVEVKCTASNLPEYLEVDLGNLELDHSIHLSDIKLPKGVEIPALAHTDHNPSIVSVSTPKGIKSDDNETSEAGASGEPTAE